MSDTYTPTDSELNSFLASFAGCDGGNLNAPYWICGIEWGGSTDALDTQLKPDDEPGAWDKARQEDETFSARSTGWQYHQKSAKLMLSIRDIRKGKAEPDLQIDRYKKFMCEELYVTKGDTFKLNLFPFCSPSVAAEKTISGYYVACEKVRFPFLKSLRRTYKPKFVICTGVSFTREFALAFGFNEKFENFKISHNGGKERNCYAFHEENSTLIVVPFFGGRHGLNSNGLLVELARKIVALEKAESVATMG